MSCHIKTLIVPHNGVMLYADLRLVRTQDGLRPQLRITRRNRVERLLGTAELNAALEIVRYKGEELADGERAALERALLDHVGPAE